MTHAKFGKTVTKQGKPQSATTSMKRLPILLAVLQGILCTAAAQSTSSPSGAVVTTDSAPRLAEVISHRASGSGVCRVRFNSAGRVAEAVMVRTTGSAVLDEDMLKSARKNWHGLPDTMATIPVNYSTAPLKNSGTIHYETPVPEYPFWAERRGIQGRCVVQVIFNEHGSPTFAQVTRSSGCQPLDDSTVKYALAHWKSSGSEESVLTYPVAYVLHHSPFTEGQALPPSVQSFPPTSL